MKVLIQRVAHAKVEVDSKIDWILIQAVMLSINSAESAIKKKLRDLWKNTKILHLQLRFKKKEEELLYV